VAELELVVDEIDARTGKQRLKHAVDRVREGLHLCDLVGRRPAEHADVVVVHQRVVQRVALRKNSKIGSASLAPSSMP